MLYSKGRGRDFFCLFFLTATFLATAPARAQQADAGVDADWAAEVQQRIADGEYSPRLGEGDGLEAHNRAHNLKAHFDWDGVHVVPRRADTNFDLVLRLVALRRGGVELAVDAVDPWTGECVDEALLDEMGECVRRVEYPQIGLTEWWSNTRAGLEHGFTLEDMGDGDTLEVDLDLAGMSAEIQDSGREVDLTSGVTKLMYSNLRVFGADGVDLPAHFESWAGGIRIVADTTGAVWPITVDPLLTSAPWTAEVDQASAQFGFSVASAGDVNGDGYGDVIIGAPSYDAPSTNEGRAYIYPGSASGLGATPIWTAEGNQDNAQYGFSVASAGDINGDGCGDIVVGAPFFDTTVQDSGAAYIYLTAGSPCTLGTSASWMLKLNQPGAQFGYSVASAGDVDNDGCSDVAVGAPYYDGGLTDEGAAFIYYSLGSSPTCWLDTVPGWSAESNDDLSYFGISVAAVGDTNGDGNGDFLVGARQQGSNNKGAAHLYLGAASGLATTPVWSGLGTVNSQQFGVRVAAGGDINGDGYADALVGTNVGDVLTFFGSNSAAVFATFGQTVDIGSGPAYAAGLGDVNGDGYGDVVFGASQDNKAYVKLGGPNYSSASWDWTGTGSTGSSFGGAVASAGDVNGDGLSDFIVGASNHTNGQTNEGRAYVYLGATAGIASGARALIDLNTANAALGYSVASAGDINGDGFGDLIVGAPFYSGQGRAFIFHGSSLGASGTPTQTLSNNVANAGYGAVVSSAGDVNADGYADVLVAADYDNKVTLTNAGAAYLYLGSASGLQTPTPPVWQQGGSTGNTNYGSSLAGVGDINGDGYDDVVVGSDLYNGSTSGRLHYYYGTSSGLSAAIDWREVPAAARFGAAVAGAGDVNGDGFADVIVGAPFSNDLNGGAHVYLGGVSGLSTSPSITLSGTSNDKNFGAAVGFAGDVNGDGYSDVIVGSPLAKYNVKTDSGAAYVYRGTSASTGVVGTPLWSFYGTLNSEQLGASVGTAGDVNRDGYADILAGAPKFGDATYTNRGRVHVFHGSATGPGASPALTLLGGGLSAGLGSSVASAGDANGDGFSDIILGASGFDSGEGRALLYLGNEVSLTPSPVPMQLRQLRVGTNIPISPATRASSMTSFDVSARVRPPMGRGPVKLQVETKPVGTNFDGTGTSTSSSWADSGLAGTPVTQPVTGLTSCTAVHWRVRILYSPVRSGLMLTSPWFYGGVLGLKNGLHLRTQATHALFYRDVDNDQAGAAASGTAACWLAGYVPAAGDCNDNDATVKPGGDQICGDNKNNNCLAVGWPSLVGTNEYDDDIDGVTECAGDCADGDNQRAPGFPEVCDGIDNNCANGLGDDGAQDPQLGVSCDGADADLCKTGTFSCSGGALVCSDDSVSTPEECDGEDNDCDGENNEGLPVIDSDGDGHYTTGSCAQQNDDCNDSDSLIHPGVSESCNGADDNCDGQVDEGISLIDQDGDGAFASVACEKPVDCDDTNPDVWDTCDTCVDGDRDGYFVECDDFLVLEPDCNDSDPAVHPGRVEACNGIDDNCDGEADEDLEVDADGDKWPGSSGCALARVDCDDANDRVWQTCDTCVDADGDGLFYFCDGHGDKGPDCDDSLHDANWFALDLDGDGHYANCNGGQALPVADCDDGSFARFPGADEVSCDDIDNNCNGLVDEPAPSACGAPIDTATLATVAPIRLSRDEQGNVASLSLLGPNVPLAPGSSAAELLGTFEAFVQSNYQVFRLISPQDTPAFVLEAMIGGVPALDPSAIDAQLGKHEAPPFPNAVTLRLQQRAGPARIIDGDLRITFVDGHLRFIDGRIWSQAELQGLTSDMLLGPLASYNEALAIATAACPGLIVSEQDDSDLFPQLLQADIEAGTFAYYFECNGRILPVDVHAYAAMSLVDLFSGDDWENHPVRVRTVLDSNDVSNLSVIVVDKVRTIRWVPDRTSTSLRAYRQIKENMLVERKRKSGENCDFRATYSGHGFTLDSVTPFPRTNNAVGEAHHPGGACEDGGSAFTKHDHRFHYQVAHQKISQAARHAKWQYEMALFSAIPPVDRDELRVNVKWDDVDDCGGNPGQYNNLTEDICLNFAAGLNPWRTPLHEYGHYIADLYGMNAGMNNWFRCREQSTREGVADAFVLFFEHFRYRGANLTNTETLPELFVNGAGSGLSRDGFTVEANEVHVNPHGACFNGDENDNRYSNGLAISQVMWKFLNNHVCTSGTCTKNSVAPDLVRVGSGPDGAYESARLARWALVWSLATLGSRYRVSALLTRMLDFMTFSVTPLDEQVVREAFAQHGIE